ncbi:MAG TPA: hypothetical protein PLF63_12365, partial [Rubrivivax sp.]|nr:hypothetical protein [Rubrivivax sp.]
MTCDHQHAEALRQRLAQRRAVAGSVHRPAPPARQRADDVLGHLLLRRERAVRQLHSDARAVREVGVLVGHHHHRLVAVAREVLREHMPPALHQALQVRLQLLGDPARDGVAAHVLGQVREGVVPLAAHDHRA